MGNQRISSRGIGPDIVRGCWGKTKGTSARVQNTSSQTWWLSLTSIIITLDQSFSGLNFLCSPKNGVRHKKSVETSIARSTI